MAGGYIRKYTPSMAGSSRGGAKKAKAGSSKGSKPSKSSGKSSYSAMPAPRAAPATSYARGAVGSSTRSITFSDKERVQTVSGTATSFLPTGFYLNAGNSTLFKWLSKHGELFEKYRFKKLVFHFRTQMPTTQAGNILMAYDPDASDSAPSDATEMSQQAKYVDTPVWSQKCSLAIPYDKEWRYVLAGNGAPEAGKDIRLTHLGRLWVANEGTGATAIGSLGSLEVEYVVEFKQKNPGQSAGVSPNRSVTELTQLTNINVPSTNVNMVFNAAPVYNGAAVNVEVAGFTLKPGTYMISGQTPGVACGSIDLMVAGTNMGTFNNGYSTTDADQHSISKIVKVDVASLVHLRTTCSTGFPVGMSGYILHIELL